MTLVSWRQRISGCASLRKRSTISMRKRTELMFQETILSVSAMPRDVAISIMARQCGGWLFERRRPAPPPGHSTPVYYGWPGGGAGRCRPQTKAPLSGQKKRSEEHTTELQSLMRNSYAVCCLKKKTKITKTEQK